ncbi:MAG TPA: DUF4010 domain-containing protein, partial [Bacteroidia bacterium]|nr:DUF4010 domain-containing protein [Bacteroidia bacterium]
LAAFFNMDVAIRLLPYFIALIILSTLIAVYFSVIKKVAVKISNEVVPPDVHQNPLEFKTAVLFGGLFILFAMVTGFVVSRYGAHGAQTLAFVVGVTDIDPFIINLFQGKWNLDTTVITLAVLNAITSNNILKMIYALTLSEKSLRKKIVVGFTVLIVAGIIAVLI